MSVHHQTIRKYVAALLDLFNDLEVQYATKAGTILTKNVPIRYSSREKSKILDEHSAAQIKDGNYNFLPRANLSLSSMVKADQRITNKNSKINTARNGDLIEFSYNSVPYEFTFEISVMCRGMNEATMLVEQFAPKFNPTVNIDIWDAQNLSEPTRIPVKLLDVSMESEEYEEISSNIVTVSFGISLMGNLYQPIKTTAAVNKFKMYINELSGDFYSKTSVLGWDVDNGVLSNPTRVDATDPTLLPPTIIDIVGNNVVVGVNDIVAIYEDQDNQLSELSFVWSVLSGPATIVGSLNNATLDVSTAGDVTVELTITDVFGNFISAEKTFTIA